MFNETSLAHSIKQDEKSSVKRVTKVDPESCVTK